MRREGAQQCMREGAQQCMREGARNVGEFARLHGAALAPVAHTAVGAERHHVGRVAQTELPLQVARRQLALRLRVLGEHARPQQRLQQ